MHGKSHHYPIRMRWTGNTGQGTRDYRGYERAHEYSVEGKPVIPGSSDPTSAAIARATTPKSCSSCRSRRATCCGTCISAPSSKIVVVDYVDDAVGTMVETAETGGHFTEVILRPAVTLAAGSDADLAESLHDRAHHLCFVANSVNFPVRCEPRIRFRPVRNLLPFRSLLRLT